MRTTLGLEKIAPFGYNFLVVDSQKIPTNRQAPIRIGARPPGPASQAFSFRARNERLQLLEKRTCGFFRRGIVFAASRCAGRDEAGTLRAAALISSTGGQRVRRRLSKK